jgi:hypothetical protein
LAIFASRNSPQHLQAVPFDLFQQKRPALCHVELDRRLARGEEAVNEVQGVWDVAEDVDIVEIGHEQVVWTQGSNFVVQKVSDSQREHQGTKGITLSDSLGRRECLDRSRRCGENEVAGSVLGPPACSI